MCEYTIRTMNAISSVQLFDNSTVLPCPLHDTELMPSHSNIDISCVFRVNLVK